MHRLLVLALVGCGGVAPVTAPDAPAPTFAVLRVPCAFATVWGVNDSLWLLPPHFDFRVDTGATVVFRWSPTISTGAVLRLTPRDTVRLACTGDNPR